MADVVRCRCTCHLDAAADRVLAIEGTFWHLAFVLAQAVKDWEGVDVSDPLEAAVACPDCLARHCPALLPSRAWAPEAPAAQPPYEASPDATGGDGPE